MADLSSVGEATKAVRDPFGTFFGWVAGFIPEGPLRTLFVVVAGLCVAAIPFVYKYYLRLLAHGGKPEGSIERQDYDGFRASLIEGNLAERLYAKWLSKFLDWIEHFFGDKKDKEKGIAHRTLFPHAFGLKKAAPLWTAPAFDRCLLLALFYPVVTILFIWGISGHVGPAEAALSLKPDPPGWQTGLVAVEFGLLGYLLWQLWTKNWTRALLTWVAVTGIEPFAQGSAPVVFAVFTMGVGAIAAGTVAGPGAVVCYAAITGLCDLAYAAAGTVTTTHGTVQLFFSVCVFWFVSNKFIELRLQGVFLTLFFYPYIIPFCLYAAASLSSLNNWGFYGPALLFLGLLTLLNAPFDWASLGLTRALLRRGLELGGWWPYLLALVDACLAAFIIALLALTMVIGVQAFDELAVHGGGEKAAVLPLAPLFEGIARNPGAPEYWWAYALLLSTMIPSLVNLAIGGMALTRGVPGVSRLLLHWIPEGREVPDYRRPLAALALTGQMFAGAFLGIAAQALLAWGLLFHLMPAIGLDLLWLCQELAEFDLPGKFFHLTGIIR